MRNSKKYLLWVLAIITIFLAGCASKNVSPRPSSSLSKTFLESNLEKENSLPSPQDNLAEEKPQNKEQDNEEQDNNVKALSNTEEDTTTSSQESPQELIDTALEYYNLALDLRDKGDDEGSLHALDQAYELILQVETDDQAELIQQKEDLRFMIAKRILEIYASRHTSCKGFCSEIPLVINKYVEYEIKRFQTVERSFFLNAYKRSGRYRPMIVKYLRQAGLPEELSWLPLIESGFKVKALSRARALGLWQFIPSTGYKFGLKRNAWIDERMDPEKSTKAAIAYLKELHNIFGDWTTVLAAYNCGEGHVLRVIRRQKINYLDNFWDLYQKLPRETARYVPRFLAVLHILKDPEKYGFKLPQPDPPLEYDVVEVHKQYSLKSIAKALGIKSQILAEFNPELRYKVTPPKYTLKIPKGYGPKLVALLENKKIKPWKPAQTYYVYHRLRRGETLSHLARRYRTSVTAIMRVNNISNPRRLRAGQKLKIPVGRKYVAKRYHKKTVTYVVRRGDSLWKIAKKFNTSPKKIMRVNRLSTTRLKIGQVLRIPLKEAS